MDEEWTIPADTQAKTPVPVPAAVAPTAPAAISRPEAQPQPTAPAAISRPEAQPQPTAPQVQANTVPAPISTQQQLRSGLSARQEYEEMVRLENERKKQEFMQKVLEARNKAAAPPPPPQPVTPAILERTRLEMEEGRKQNERHAAHHRVHPQPRGHNPMASNETTPVYRPTDHVPNMDQGQIPTQTYKQL